MAKGQMSKRGVDSGVITTHPIGWISVKWPHSDWVDPKVHEKPVDFSSDITSS